VIHQQEYAPHLPVGIQQITNANTNAKKALILGTLPNSRIKAFFIFKNLREQAYKQKS